MLKFKKGERCIVSQFTWDSMSQDERDNYMDHPDGAGIEVESISLNANLQPEVTKIQLKSPAMEQLEKDNAELLARLAKLEGKQKEETKVIVEKPIAETQVDENIDPMTLEFEPLKAWLKIKGVEFSAKISKLETLQKFIPDGSQA